jgi:predicted short-subunit dehydrogenase-like oxidoreductase (DUF2520 family)
MIGPDLREASMRTLRIVGRGRAGRSFAIALHRVGWSLAEPLGHEDDCSDAAADADLVLISVPDAEIATVASRVHPRASCAIAHLSGSLGLGVLGAHPRRAAIHPLVSLPNPELGADRLAAGAWFAIAGDPLAAKVVSDLGGRCVAVADERRVEYHAAACIASNHLVALMGQVQRVAASADVPLEVYLDLVRETIDNVAQLGPAAALTGPVARGDVQTVERHLAAIDPSERNAYRAMAEAAGRLVAGE